VGIEKRKQNPNDRPAQAILTLAQPRTAPLPKTFCDHFWSWFYLHCKQRPQDNLSKHESKTGKELREDSPFFCEDEPASTAAMGGSAFTPVRAVDGRY
ncbi:MAG: hypothetical protein QGG71_10150, partial [Pirellulaceae bacterium]|nr:hypothetical protein [Pirellulaceae bacterium]